MKWEQYTPLPQTVNAYEITEDDIDDMIELTRTWAELDGRKFHHIGKVCAGDYLMCNYVTETRHCRRDIFEARYTAI